MSTPKYAAQLCERVFRFGNHIHFRVSGSVRDWNLCHLRARALRAMDRAYNQDKYPSLCYPNVYVIEGGYCKMFHDYSREVSERFVLRRNESNFYA